jgi:hypothetical protein
MSKQSERHRYTGLVHALYALTFLAVAAWIVLLFMGVSDRWTSGLFALTNVLPLVAFAIDATHSPSEEDK